MPKNKIATTPHSRRRPTGVWRCTRSALPAFKVGQEYGCAQIGPSFDASGRPIPSAQRSYRIFPRWNDIDRNCAPYWDHEEGRFCYPRWKLDFKFVRPLTDDEHDQLTSLVSPEAAQNLRPFEFADDFNRETVSGLISASTPGFLNHFKKPWLLFPSAFILGLLIGSLP